MIQWVDFAVVGISLSIIFGLAYFIFDKGGVSLRTDCIHANSTEFIAIYMSCPSVIDNHIKTGWNISTFGDNMVYLWKQ
jgi:hypothetical protein